MIGIWLIWKLPKWVVVVSSLALLKFIPHPLGKSSKKVVPENILFDDLVGLEDAKPLFQKILHRVRKRKNKKLEIGILDVVLLYGRKGTGKSTLVHALVREAKAPFFPISARDIARSEA
uniref:ATP-dependent zinc metalloprotease FtsH-like n=1 Tax=Erigeron canadensis TaxID=72917 RepID=UPI001CB99EC2|nr:ATP-dependent zinc metalloprotease FtsH-like [Erigeron canadensis]